MTLLEIETFLSARGLRLRQVTRPPRARRWVVVVSGRSGTFEATGIDVRAAVENAVDAAKKRPVKNRRRSS